MAARASCFASWAFLLVDFGALAGDGDAALRGEARAGDAAYEPREERVLAPEVLGEDGVDVLHLCGNQPVRRVLILGDDVRRRAVRNRREQVDGVEIDAAIQDERAVNLIDTVLHLLGAFFS